MGAKRPTSSMNSTLSELLHGQSSSGKQKSWFQPNPGIMAATEQISLLTQLQCWRKVCSSREVAFDFIRVWNQQDITPITSRVLEITAKLVYEDIMNPMSGVSNIGEWCKKDACWIRMQRRVDELIRLLPEQFFNELIGREEAKEETTDAVKIQKIYNGIEAQKTVFEVPAYKWAEILAQGQKKQLYSPKELGVLRIAVQIPSKIPSEKQSFVLLEILEKAKLEAIYQE